MNVGIICSSHVAFLSKYGSRSCSYVTCKGWQRIGMRKFVGQFTKLKGKLLSLVYGRMEFLHILDFAKVQCQISLRQFCFCFTYC